MAESDLESEFKGLLDSVSPYLLEEDELPYGGKAAEVIADLPFLSGNQTELLIDGERTFENIVQGIERAEEYVLFQFFIVKDDELGRQLKDRLIRKAKAGVAVYFLYDEIGSIGLPKSYLNDLTSAGIKATFQSVATFAKEGLTN